MKRFVVAKLSVDLTPFDLRASWPTHVLSRRRLSAVSPSEKGLHKKAFNATAKQMLETWVVAAFYSRTHEGRIRGLCVFAESTHARCSISPASSF